MKGEDIADRLLEFAVQILRVGAELRRTPIGRHVAGQLTRCSTAAGANYEEARSAESRADFIHKVSIATKELRESYYWLRLMARTGLIHTELVRNLTKHADELIAILTASAKTAKNRRNEES